MEKLNQQDEEKKDKEIERENKIFSVDEKYLNSIGLIDES